LRGALSTARGVTTISGATFDDDNDEEEEGHNDREATAGGGRQ
jgi:hypothetical protein